MNKLIWVLVVLVLMGTSFIGGVLLNDFPLVSFDSKIDLDTVMSFIGIIGAVVLVPLVINRYYSKRDTTNLLIISDIDGALAALDNLGIYYKKIYFEGKAIDGNDRREIQSTFRKVSNHLKTIVDKAEKHPGIKDFRVKVYEYFNAKTYKSCTENLVNGKAIDDNLYLQVENSINALVNRLRKTKYNLT